MSNRKLYERILIYTKLPDATGGCIYCDKSKEWLADHQIPFAFEELCPTARQLMYDRLGLKDGQRTVPQIFILDDEGEQHRIGGYNDLVKSRLETLFFSEAPLNRLQVIQLQQS